MAPKRAVAYILSFELPADEAACLIECDVRRKSRRGTHYVRGHYSRDGGIDNMKRQLQEMLDNADDDSIRRAIQRCMDAIEG